MEFIAAHLCRSDFYPVLPRFKKPLSFFLSGPKKSLQNLSKTPDQKITFWPICFCVKTSNQRAQSHGTSEFGDPLREMVPFHRVNLNG